MEKETYKINTSYFLRAARNFYFIAIIAVTSCLLYNQTEYFKNSRWGLIITDAITIFIIYLALFLYLRKKTGIKLNSSIFVYTTLLNLSISTWYYYYQDIFFTSNFLFTTFMYCINIVVAGLCINRKHAFITSGLYVISLGPLVFISGDIFLKQNAIAIILLIILFATGVSGFLSILEKTHKDELFLREEIFEKDKTLVAEHNKLLTFELECKQKEILAKTMFLAEYAENNNAFIKKLNELKERLKASDQKLLNDVILNYRFNHHENYWKEFEASFMEVRPEFYNNLQKICPGLTPNELKLAALVHLGLSSKQIGSLSSNAPESVDVARSRLRSKLNLSADANLKTFLQTF